MFSSKYGWNVFQSVFLVVTYGGLGLLIAAVLSLAIAGVRSDERSKLECIWYLFLGNPCDTKKSRNRVAFVGRSASM